MCYFSSFELFLLVGGGYALFVLATVVLRNAVISRVLAWFWVGFGKIAFVYDTVFRHFATWIVRVFVGRCYFSSFELVLSSLGIIVCVCGTPVPKDSEL